MKAKREKANIKYPVLLSTFKTLHNHNSTNHQKYFSSAGFGATRRPTPQTPARPRVPVLRGCLCRKPYAANIYQKYDATVKYQSGTS